jgi:hypothetical protein
MDRLPQSRPNMDIDCAPRQRRPSGDGSALPASRRIRSALSLGRAALLFRLLLLPHRFSLGLGAGLGLRLRLTLAIRLGLALGLNLLLALGLSICLRLSGLFELLRAQRLHSGLRLTLLRRVRRLNRLARRRRRFRRAPLLFCKDLLATA